ncbi:MAG: hypothetical protein ACOCYO_08480 [Bacteroidota bacterium]
MYHSKAVALILFICFVVFSKHALAFNVGKFGETYDIVEPDLEEIIKDRAQHIDMDKIKAEWQEQAKEKIKTYRLPTAVSDLAVTEQNKLYKVNLTYTLPRDIKNLDGSTIYPKGFTFNPVERFVKAGINYPFKLVILNPKREVEMDWFERNFADDLNSRLLITDGYVWDLIEDMNRPVFYLTEIIKKKFNITSTPSVIFHPPGSMHFFVLEVALVEEAEDPEKATEDVEPIEIPHENFEKLNTEEDIEEIILGRRTYTDRHCTFDMRGTFCPG